MILISCTKHPGYTGSHPVMYEYSNWPCLACEHIYSLRQQAEKRAQLGVKVGEASEAWKVEDAIKRTD